MSFDCYELHPLNVGYFVMLPYVTVRGRHVVGMVTFVRRTLVSKVSNWSHQKCDFEAQDLDALYFEIIILPRVSQDANARCPSSGRSEPNLFGPESRAAVIGWSKSTYWLDLALNLVSTSLPDESLLDTQTWKASLETCSHKRSHNIH